MEWLRFIIEFAFVVLGLCYLCFKHSQRVRNWKPLEPPEEWAGHGIDTSGLQPRMEELRRDHMTERRVAIDIGFRRALIGFARKAVRQLGYFRHSAPEHHAHDQSQ
jgi:hypothetical protein